MGFAEQLRAILGAMSESRQTLLFSATLPAALAEFARAGLRDPELVRLDVESKLSPDLGLAFFTVRRAESLCPVAVPITAVIAIQCQSHRLGQRCRWLEGSLSVLVCLSCAPHVACSTRVTNVLSGLAVWLSGTPIPPPTNCI